MSLSYDMQLIQVRNTIIGENQLGSVRIATGIKLSALPRIRMMLCHWIKSVRNIFLIVHVFLSYTY